MRNALAREIRNKFVNFIANDTRGNVALIFALALPVILGTAGAGIDLGRGSALRSSLQQSVDATSQTLTDVVKTCHDKNRTNNVTIDTGCLNDPTFMADLRASAQTLVTSNFKQHGYDQAPALTGPISLDQLNGRLSIQATVGYNCVVFRVINNSCNLLALSGTNANLSTQAATMNLAGPNGSRNIYVGEAGTNLPLVFSVSGGWTAYSWGATGMPQGLGLNPDGSTEVAQISGTPADPTACVSPSPCNPLPLVPTGVSVVDSGDQNRGGLNRQQVQGVVNFNLIRPLGVAPTGVMTTIPGGNASSYYTDARRSGGTGSYTFSCTGLPAGMSCDSSTGRVSGMPNYNQSGTLTITVTDLGDGRTSSGVIGYNFVPPPINLSFGTSYFTGNNADPVSTTVTATGGVGVINMSCGNLPNGFVHSSYPAVESNNSTISGTWNSGGQQSQSGSLYCTATDQAGQVKTAYLPYQMDYMGNPDCLSNPAVQCPGSWQAAYTSCINGNGRWVCIQQWTFVGGDLSQSEVPAPGPDMNASPNGSVCASDGSAMTAPVYGCHGGFYGCSSSKGWSKASFNTRCYPRS